MTMLADRPVTQAAPHGVSFLPMGSWQGEGLSIIMPVGGVVAADPWRYTALDWLLRRYARLLPDAQLCAGVSERDPYNRAEARNVAFERATGDVLMVADADTIFNLAQIRSAVEMVRDRAAPWVLPYSDLGYYNLTKAATDAIVAATTGAPLPPETFINEPVEGEWEHKLHSCGGIHILPRSAWVELGGYPEHQWLGWGGEDNAWQLALDTLVGHHSRLDGWVCHLWHDRGDADFSQPHWPQNARMLERYRRASGNPHAMRSILRSGRKP